MTRSPLLVVLAAVAAALLVGQAAAGLSSPLCNADNGVCYAGVRNAEDALCRTLYAGKSYTFVMEYIPGVFPFTCWDQADRTGCVGVDYSAVARSTQLVGNNVDFSLNGYDQKEATVVLSIDETTPDSLFSTQVYVDFRRDCCPFENTTTLTYRQYAIQVPGEGCGGGGASRRSLGVATTFGLQPSLTFGQWSNPATFFIDPEQALEGTEQMTVSFEVVHDGNINATVTTGGGCYVDPPTYTFTASQTAVDVVFRCFNDGATFSLVNKSSSQFYLAAYYESSSTVSVRDYFLGPNQPNRLLVNSGIMVSNLNEYVLDVVTVGLNSVENDNGVNVEATFRLISRDSNGRAIPVSWIGSGQTSGSLTLSESTVFTSVTPTSIAIPEDFVTDTFTAIMSLPDDSLWTSATAFNSFIAQLVSSNDDVFTLRTGGAGAGAEFLPLTMTLFRTNSFTATAAATTAWVDSSIPVTLTSTYPMGADSVPATFFFTGSSATARCQVSDDGTTWSDGVAVTISAATPSPMVWVRPNPVQSVPNVPTSSSFLCTLNAIQSDESAALTDIYSDITLPGAFTFVRHSVTVDAPDASSNMIPGLDLWLDVTVDVLPANDLTVTPVVDAFALEGFALSPASLTFGPTTARKQRITLSATEALITNGGIALNDIYMVLSGTDENLYFISQAGGPSMTDVVGGSLTVTAPNTNSLPWGATTDAYWISAFPAPSASVTVTVMCDYGTPSGPVTLTAASPVGSFTVQLDADGGRSATAVQCQFSVTGPDARFYTADSSLMPSPFTIAPRVFTLCGLNALLVRSMTPGSTSCAVVGLDVAPTSGTVVVDVVPRDDTAGVVFTPAFPLTFGGAGGPLSTTVCMTQPRPGRVTYDVKVTGDGMQYGAMCTTDATTTSFLTQVSSAYSSSAGVLTSVYPFGDFAVLVDVSVAKLALAGTGLSTVITPSAPSMPAGEVTFVPASVTLSDGRAHDVFQVSYSPAAGSTPVSSFSVVFASSNAAIPAPSAVSVSVQLPYMQAGLTASNTDYPQYRAAYTAATSIPVPNGLSLTVTSSCMTPNSFTIDWAAGEQHKVEYVQLLTEQVASGTVGSITCDVTRTWSGTDRALFGLPMVETADFTSANLRSCYSFDVASSNVAWIDGMWTAPFPVSLPVPTVSGVVTLTPIGADFEFLPEVLVFSPAAPVQYLRVRPTAFRGDGAARIRFQASAPSDPALELYLNSPCSAGISVYVQPNIEVGPIQSLAGYDAVGEAWISVNSVLPTPMSLRLSCSTGSSLSSDLIAFEPTYLFFDDVTTNVSFSYQAVRQYQPQTTSSSTAGNRCSLVYVFSTNNFANNPVSSLYRFQMSTTNEGGAQTISIVAPTVGRIIPNLPFEIHRSPTRASVLVSPPSEYEILVDVSSPNLRVTPAVLAIPPHTQEYFFMVEAIARPQPMTANNAYVVTWTINTGASQHYQMSCGSTSCSTEHYAMGA